MAVFLGWELWGPPSVPPGPKEDSPCHSLFLLEAGRCGQRALCIPLKPLGCFICFFNLFCLFVNLFPNLHKDLWLSGNLVFMKYFLIPKEKNPYNPEDSWPPEITTLCLSLLQNLPRNSHFNQILWLWKNGREKPWELLPLFAPTSKSSVECLRTGNFHQQRDFWFWSRKERKVD